jgi:hypothetical protein
MLNFYLAHVMFLFLFFLFCDLNLDLNMPLIPFWFRKSCKFGCFHACDIISFCDIYIFFISDAQAIYCIPFFFF